MLLGYVHSYRYYTHRQTREKAGGLPGLAGTSPSKMDTGPAGARGDPRNESTVATVLSDAPGVQQRPSCSWASVIRIKYCWPWRPSADYQECRQDRGITAFCSRESKKRQPIDSSARLTLRVLQTAVSHFANEGCARFPRRMGGWAASSGRSDAHRRGRRFSHDDPPMNGS